MTYVESNTISLTIWSLITRHPTNHPTKDIATTRVAIGTGTLANEGMITANA